MTFSSFLSSLQNAFKSKIKTVGKVFGLSLLVASLASGVYLVQQRQSAKTRASNPALSLTSTNTSPNVGNTFIVTVGLNTQGMSVSAADIKVRYDTTLLEAQSIEAIGTSLPTVLIPGLIDYADTSSGRASIVLGCPIDSAGAYPANGTGLPLAQITFKAKSPGTANITFGGLTAIAAVGQSTNTVGTMSPIAITVLGPGATATATAIAVTSAPTASPITSATATATAIASATASPTAKTADLDGDGDVDIIDLGKLIDNYRKSPLLDPNTDLDGDGDVDIIDLGKLIDNYGK